MLVYAFIDSPTPPRTVWREKPEEKPCSNAACNESSALEKAIMAVLHLFPDAYHAVLEECRRIPHIQDVGGSMEPALLDL